jgi:hypothetical protein
VYQCLGLIAPGDPGFFKGNAKLHYLILQLLLRAQVFVLSAKLFRFVGAVGGQQDAMLGPVLGQCWKQLAWVIERGGAAK